MRLLLYMTIVGLFFVITLSAGCTNTQSAQSADERQAWSELANAKAAIQASNKLFEEKRWNEVIAKEELVIDHYRNAEKSFTLVARNSTKSEDIEKYTDYAKAAGLLAQGRTNNIAMAQEQLKANPDTEKLKAYGAEGLRKADEAEKILDKYE